jgi:hypothetical protein
MGRGMARARCSAAGAVAAAALVLGLCNGARAYTAAGDRLFPATLVLPQIGPGDEFYVNGSTLPLTGGAPGTNSRANNFSATYNKTITDRLGVVFEENYTTIGRVGQKTAYGWQNFDTAIKYLAIVDQPHEFLFTVGVDREFGGTGAARVGASNSGATTPAVFFGKGLGDLDIGYWRPLAVTGVAGYQIADTRPRPDRITPGFVVEYSIPYLQSKVQSLDLPEFVRGLTPMTEVSFTIPNGPSYGARTTALIAPGISYAGEGWELAIEGLVPETRATGKGLGAIAQLHLSLDYLLPDTLGRPLLSTP